ncbi:hypothetical protein EDD27_3157 [Nonomuraea polychroma]|uniref:Uncharacterized protein n=1 Tax=Nonomuraea polychroma TaxID=46176 RepID=A0A438M4F3_9ACTN|nr:hypothetical protein EDD27_3157 [Nonomuraea polychroma]
MPKGGMRWAASPSEDGVPAGEHLAQVVARGMQRLADGPKNLTERFSNWLKK